MDRADKINRLGTGAAGTRSKGRLGMAGFLFSVFCLLSSVSWAADYASLSNDELFELRIEMRKATGEEQNAFLTEWLKRVDAMADEEKRKYVELLKKEQEEARKAREKEEKQEKQEKVPFYGIGQGYEMQQKNNKIISGGNPEDAPRP